MRRLIHDLWIHWRKSYLQTLQARNKWKKVHPNLQVKSIVILKDSTFQKPTWPLARVEQTFPGPDSLVRVVDVYCASYWILFADFRSTLARLVVKYI